jgi:hypothetical protein
MGNPRRAMRYTHQRKGASSLPWLLVGIGVLVGLTALTLASLHTDPANSSEVSSMPSAQHSSTPQTGVQGMPAITPHLNLAANAASTASGGSATLPTFTADDASAWVMAQLLPAYQATGTVTVRSVTFLPSEQVSQLPNLGGNLGLPAGTPLCVVVLDGTFPDIQPWTGPSSLRGSAPPVTYSYAIAVFNGVTGNLLGRGVTNSLPAPVAAAATPTTGTTPTTPTTPATPTTGTTPTTTTTPGTGTPTP